MKRLLAILSVLALLSACTNDTDDGDVIVDPDLHPVVLNTGKLLSIDGSRMHIAYSYDEMGRVTYAEQFDTTWYIVKKIGEYRYDANRIYISFMEFEEKLNGERNSAYSGEYVRDDTLFLIGGRVDSCAGAMKTSLNSFFYKFRYNEQGELIYVKDDNVHRDRKGKLEVKPWYTEIYLLEWQDGNVLRRTSIDPIHRDTTICDYRYSSLTGSFVLNDPRNVLYDFVPLMQSGYFGKSCKNLSGGLEAKNFTEQTNYMLDEQGMVSQMKSNVIWDDGVSHDYEYSIRWDRCD